MCPPLPKRFLHSRIDLPVRPTFMYTKISTLWNNMATNIIGSALQGTIYYATAL